MKLRSACLVLFLASACGGAEPTSTTEDAARARRWTYLFAVSAIRNLVRVDTLAQVSLLNTGVPVASDTGGTGNTGDTGFEEECEYPEGTTTVTGRCQVGVPGGGTIECDCASDIDTSHDANGMCVYEVVDIWILGNCGADDGIPNDPPAIDQLGF